jgi:hypothetical protein
LDGFAGDHLFVEPSVTVQGISKALKIPVSTAANLTGKLLTMNILREVTGGTRNRVFLAQGVVDIFSTDDATTRRNNNP